MKRSLFLILLPLFVLSCDSNETSENIKVDSTLISKGNLYGNGQENIDKQNIVLENQSSWNSLISKMDTVNNESDNFSETDIDFSKYTVIAVFEDIKANGGHALELNITSNSQTILVEVINTSPKGNATTVITQPYHIVKISKNDLPIVFN
ncbi:protease complex subunit PrcB family protein [Seonamhaeicola marinus]|uniref:Protease complex subunit PrcB family protein n=1 Tax=Seonamhaeicola marinus TaxID=1912246 RepID=A0A5D0J9L5_9FLAO|nr:protease complex subunit PrcB family protein [Seonamhaeicola marinus]TYA92201.1 hypothetical protein FUA24_01865 [Seonamhaeicola marinus]